MNVNHFLRQYLGVYFLEAKDLEFLRSECGSTLDAASVAGIQCSDYGM